MNTEQILVLSTAHITPETNDLLEKNQTKIDYEPINWGYLIQVDNEFDQPDDESDTIDYPQDLVEILKFAIQNNIQWIKLDRDGFIINSLPQYDW